MYFQPPPPRTPFHRGQFHLTLGRRFPTPILTDWGRLMLLTLTLCPLVRAFIRAFYSVEDSNTCA